MTDESLARVLGVCTVTASMHMAGTSLANVQGTMFHERTMGHAWIWVYMLNFTSLVVIGAQECQVGCIRI